MNDKTSDTVPADADGAVDGAEAGGDAAAPQPSDRERELEAQLADMRDKAVRALAEMENLRKRTEREKQDTARYAIADFARAVVPVVDNLRRALQSAPAPGVEASADAVRTLVTGIEMTERELLAALEKHGVKPIVPVPGEPFDYNLHQAMYEAPHPQHPAGTVIEVMQGGYQLHDRLLRPAMVGVAKGPSEPGERLDTQV